MSEVAPDSYNRRHWTPVRHYVAPTPVTVPHSLCHWATWTFDNGGPSVFTPEQADDNCRYLIEVLGRQWLQVGVRSPGSRNHPLLRRWAQPGAGEFLTLNALASDLRILEGVPGLTGVLHDLKRSNTSAAAEHTLHSAAMVARAPGATIERFPPTSEAGPDYIARTAAGRVAVEAKHLEASEPARRFSTYASALLSALDQREAFAGRVRAAQWAVSARAGILRATPTPRVHPVAWIVIKDASHLPDPERVRAALAAADDEFRGAPTALRSREFNVLLEPPPNGYPAFNACHVLCPRAKAEITRVVKRASKASQQLLAEGVRDIPGLLHLGLSSHFDAHDVRTLLAREFERGSLPGISAALLSVRTAHMGAEGNAPVDLVDSLRNSTAARKIPSAIVVGHAGSVAPLALGRLSTSEVPCYRASRARATIRMGATPPGIFIPDVQSLTQEMLE